MAPTIPTRTQSVQKSWLEDNGSYIPEQQVKVKENNSGFVGQGSTQGKALSTGLGRGRHRESFRTFPALPQGHQASQVRGTEFPFTKAWLGSKLPHPQLQFLLVN